MVLKANHFAPLPIHLISNLLYHTNHVKQYGTSK